jgi:hypothetical protein
MQQLITGLLLVVWIQLNVFRESSCPPLEAYQQQQQPLVYRRNVVVAVVLDVVGPVVGNRSLSANKLRFPMPETR